MFLRTQLASEAKCKADLEAALELATSRIEAFEEERSKIIDEVRVRRATRSTFLGVPLCARVRPQLW